MKERDQRKERKERKHKSLDQRFDECAALFLSHFLQKKKIQTKKDLQKKNKMVFVC
jgi:hypothetical protein